MSETVDSSNMEVEVDHVNPNNNPNNKNNNNTASERNNNNNNIANKTDRPLKAKTKKKQQKLEEEQKRRQEEEQKAKQLNLEHGKVVLLLDAPRETKTNRIKSFKARDGTTIAELTKLVESPEVSEKFGKCSAFQEGSSAFRIYFNEVPEDREAILELLRENFHRSYFGTFSFAVIDKSNYNFDSLANTMLLVMKKKKELKFGFGGSVEEIKKKYEMPELHAKLISIISEQHPEITAVKKVSDETAFLKLDFSLLFPGLIYVHHQPEPLFSKDTSFKIYHAAICHFGEAYLKGSNRHDIMNYAVQSVKARLKEKPQHLYIHTSSNVSVVPHNESAMDDVISVCLHTPGFVNVCKAVLLRYAQSRTVSDLIKVRFFGTKERRKASSQYTLPFFSLPFQPFFLLCFLFFFYHKKKQNPKDKECTHFFIQLKNNNPLPGFPPPFPMKQIVEEVAKKTTLHPSSSPHGEKIFVIQVHLYSAEIHLIYEKQEGVGGVPILPTNTIVCLLSGGIDSPVASYLMMKRGARIVLCHFQNQSQMQDSVEDKIVQLAKVLSQYQVTLFLYIVPFGELQNQIIEKIPAQDRMLVYRFFMMQIASRIATEYNAPLLATGDSLSQVASQTIRNLEAIYHTSPRPILAPLIGMDKSEITNIARKIGTLNISQLPYGDCCSFFLAKHPALHLRTKGTALTILQDKVPKLFDIKKIKVTGFKEARVIKFQGPDSMTVVREMPEHVQKVQLQQAENSVCLFEPQEKEENQLEMEFDNDLDFNETETGDESRNININNYQNNKNNINNNNNNQNDNQNNNNHNNNNGLQMTKRQAAQIPAQKKIKVSIDQADQGIYLDNAASTQVEEAIVQTMAPLFIYNYGNASSSHQKGATARDLLEKARKTIAEAIFAEAKDLIFTGSGTEANNLAIKGTVEYFVMERRKQKNTAPIHIITTLIEHDSVTETCKAVQALHDVQITYLSVDSAGYINLDKLRNTITKNTVLVTIIHANNEIGVVQNLEEIGKICQEKQVLFHTDACQSFTKCELDVQKMQLDLVTLNGHKIHGPKGIGCLFIRHKNRIFPQMHGGGHEFSLRAGTANVPLAVGFATACQIALKSQGHNVRHMAKMANYFMEKMISVVGEDGIRLNGPSLEEISMLSQGSLAKQENNELAEQENENRPVFCKKRLPNILNIAFSRSKLQADQVVRQLSRHGVFLSTASACSNEKDQVMQISPILQALGTSNKIAMRSVRFGLSRHTTKDQLDTVAELLSSILQ